MKPSVHPIELVPATKRRGILTFGFGRPKYQEMAKDLGRSLILNSPTERRAVVTDAPDAELRELFHDIIPYHPEYGKNVEQKIFIDQYSPYDETLFIDGDSLVIRDLEPFWTTFRGMAFGVPGHRLLRAGDRDEYLDVDFLLKHFQLECLPKFNGGTYYFGRTPETAAFFATTRALLLKAREYRFSDFRGAGVCDEAIYSAAMAIHGVPMKDMGKGGMWTPLAATTPVTIDVGRKVCSFTKRDRPVEPEVMHFATWTEHYLYLRECRRMRKIAAAGYTVCAKTELSIADKGADRTRAVALRLRKAYRGGLRRGGKMVGRVRTMVQA